MSDGRSKQPRIQERAIAALLSEPTHAAAAAKAGLSPATLGRWLKDPAFAADFRAARRAVVRDAVDRLQAATGLAVDTLVAVAKDGKRDGDRVRAAVALLDHAFRGLDLGDEGGDKASTEPIEGTAGVVRVLAARLAQVDAADLPAAEKARLTTGLADALLRAIGVDVLARRLEALQAVLLAREEKR